mgnify:FL=1
MADMYIPIEIRRQNMFIDALNRVYLQNTQEKREVQKLAFKVRDFDLSKKRMPVTHEEQILLRNALNELRDQRIAEGKYTDGVESTLLEVMNPKRTKHFPW